MATKVDKKKSLSQIATEGLEAGSLVSQAANGVGGAASSIVQSVTGAAASAAANAPGNLAAEAAKDVVDAAKEAASGVGQYFAKWMVNGALLLAGIVLMVYGVMVAVRPRDRAFSLPSMPSMPVPVPV